MQKKNTANRSFSHLLLASTTPSTTTTSTTSTTTSTQKPKVRRRRDTLPFEWSVQHLVKNGLINPESIAKDDMTNFMTTTEIPMAERIKKLNDDSVPYFGMCKSNKSSSQVIFDIKKIYGYYYRQIKVENPLANLVVDNNPWLKHGDFCNVKIKYQGTAPFKYCITINSTRNDDNSSSVGDEKDCDDWRETNDKEMTIHRFLPKYSNTYTITLFLQNEVSSIKTPIAIKFYDESPHSQLSVIIVPVIFSLFAVGVIVFGVAYYVQNRNQFLIETADFDFGETSSVESMEYKSFLQRLLDSVSDLFIRQDYLDESSDHPNGPAGPSVHPDSNVRYGVMT